MFKYMLDHHEPNASKHLDTVGDANDAESELARTVAANPDGWAINGAQGKESRKKVKKACVFCKRSHMLCEEVRPCRRCVKRGVSHLCRDHEPAGPAGTPSTSASTSPSFGSSLPATISGLERRLDEAQNPALSRQGTSLANAQSEACLESVVTPASVSLRCEGGNRLPPAMDSRHRTTARDGDISTIMSISA